MIPKPVAGSSSNAYAKSVPVRGRVDITVGLLILAALRPATSAAADDMFDLSRSGMCLVDTASIPAADDRLRSVWQDLPTDIPHTSFSQTPDSRSSRGDSRVRSAAGRRLDLCLDPIGTIGSRRLPSLFDEPSLATAPERDPLVFEWRESGIVDVRIAGRLCRFRRADLPVVRIVCAE